MTANWSTAQRWWIAAASLMAMVAGAVSVANGQPNSAYQGPQAVEVTADGAMLFAACGDARQVAWVKLPGGEIVRRVDVPGEPTGMVLSEDESQLFVTCAGPASVVAILDAQSGEVLRSLPAGHTTGSPVLNGDGTRLYVCNQFNHDVSVLDVASGEELARVEVLREPVAADLTPDGRYLLVANQLPAARTDFDYDGEIAAMVTRIDTETFETRQIPLRRGTHSMRGLCVSPDGRHALVTHLMANFDMVPFRVSTGWINVNVVSVIDIQAADLVSSVGMDYYDLGVGNPWDIRYTADGKHVCVSIAGARQLCVIEEAELLSDFAVRTMQPMMAVWPIYLSLGESLWRRIQLPGTGPRGLATAGSKVFVAEYFSDAVTVVDLAEELDGGAEQRPTELYTVRYGSFNGPSAYSVSAVQYGNYAMETLALGPTPELTLERRGEMLFHDATLCEQHWQSCVSCHPAGRVDGLNWDLMNDSQGNPKNTKSMLWSHRTPPAMASGVRATAEFAVESGFRHILFNEQDHDVTAAVDAYLDSLEPVPSPYLVDGELSESAVRGRGVFERVSCDRCHPAPLYTDGRLHDVGTRRKTDYRDRFDTPTLVETWRTAPYLHDGRYLTMKDLLVEGRHGLKGSRGEELSEAELADLVEFVLSL